MPSRPAHVKCGAFSSACAADADALGRKGVDWDKVTQGWPPVLQSSAAHQLISAAIDAELKKQQEEDMAQCARWQKLGIERATVQRSGAGAALDRVEELAAMPEHEERRRRLIKKMSMGRANRLGQDGGRKKRRTRRKL